MSSLKTIKNLSYENVPRWIREIPWHLKTQEICDEAVWIELRSLSFVRNRSKTKGLCIKAVRRDPYALDCMPDNLKTQKICTEGVRENPAAFFLVPDCFKTQKMCNEAVEVDPWQVYDVPDYLKTQEICDDPVGGDSYSLQFVLDWFVIEQQIKIWDDDDEYWDGDELIEWYNGYKNGGPRKQSLRKNSSPLPGIPIV